MPRSSPSFPSSLVASLTRKFQSGLGLKGRPPTPGSPSDSRDVSFDSGVDGHASVSTVEHPRTIVLQNGLLATFTKDDSSISIPLPSRVDVLISGDKIVAIQDPYTLQDFKDALVIDCTNKWIAPGFVDTHRHLWMSVVDNQEDWTLSEYGYYFVVNVYLLYAECLHLSFIAHNLAKLSWTTAALVTAEDVYAGQLAGCLQALHSGTTAVVDHFHCANSVEHIEKAIEATAESGLRCMLCISRQSLPSSFEPFAFGNDAQVSKMQLDIIQSLAQEDQGRLTPDGRVTLGLAYDVQGYDPQEDQRILTLVRDLNVKPITLHYVGGPHGRAFSKKIRLWAEAGLLKEDVIFSHANDLLHEGCDPGEWDLLKASGASTASTPEDELGMGHGSPVAYEAVRRGVKVGLGIDCASIVSTEMFPAMRVALQCERGRLHKVRADDGKGVKYNSLSAASAFRLATLGGAETAHVETQIGSIEVGKLADIVLYNADSVNLSNCSNCSDPFRGIVLHATAEDVQWVFVNGEIVKRDGKLLRKEWSGVAENLKTRAAVIKEKVANFDLEQRYASIDKQFGLALEV